MPAASDPQSISLLNLLFHEIVYPTSSMAILPADVIEFTTTKEIIPVTATAIVLMMTALRRDDNRTLNRNAIMTFGPI